MRFRFDLVAGAGVDVIDRDEQVARVGAVTARSLDHLGSPRRPADDLEPAFADA